MSAAAPSDDDRDGGREDGRTLRARRTREAIVDACIGLVERGDFRPTAPRIAEEAGVSVRSVFQHFDDLDSLFIAVAERVVERVSQLLAPVDTGRPVDERLEAFLWQRAHLLEAVTPMRRAAAVHEPFSAAIGTWLDDAHAYLRTEVERTFAPELGDADATLLDALDVAFAWATWDSLRQRAKLDVDEATASVRLIVRRLLGLGS